MLDIDDKCNINDDLGNINSDLSNTRQDLYMLPGQHYNYTKDMLYVITNACTYI